MYPPHATAFQFNLIDRSANGVIAGVGCKSDGCVDLVGGEILHGGVFEFSSGCRVDGDQESRGVASDDQDSSRKHRSIFWKQRGRAYQQHCESGQLLKEVVHGYVIFVSEDGRHLHTDGEVYSSLDGVCWEKDQTPPLADSVRMVQRP